MARPHAQPCRSALLSGRRLAERSRLTPDRHAARHRRCADGPRQDAAPGRDVDRHNTGAQRPEGRCPRRRHGSEELSANRRCHREHERVRGARWFAPLALR